jgi:hypothetical protein
MLLFVFTQKTLGGIRMTKTLTVKEFTELVNHHSESNIKEFRKRLRAFNVIENNQTLNEDFVPVWEEICKIKETGVFWALAMDQVIKNISVNSEEPNINHSFENEKIDVVISLLEEVLMELRK